MKTPSQNVHEGTFPETTARALEGAQDIGAAALGVGVHVVADTASQTLKAAEGLASELTNATKNLAVGVIRGFHEVGTAIGQALLESARGTIQGVGLVGSDVGTVAKGAAHGFVRGAGEVSLDLGTVTKSTAFGLIHGTSEVGAEFGKIWKLRALETIKGAKETVLSAEEAVLATVRTVIQDVGKLRSKPVPSKPVDKAAPPEESPPATTNILSIAPIVTGKVESEPSEPV